MERITLIIADKNIEYIQLLKRYIRGTEYENKFIIKSFSKIEYLEKHIKSQSSIEILLIDKDYFTDRILNKNIKLIILLSETSGIEKEYKYDCIYKFQPLNKLVAQILGLYLEKFKEDIYNNKNSKTKVISIYSASGGAGKTILAINLAKQLAIRNKKIFYLNFESINAIEAFFPNSESYDLSKILFYLKNDPSVITSKIEAYKKYCSDIKIDYIESFQNINEIYDMSNDDIRILVKSIKILNIYDYIIFDLETSLQEYVFSTLVESKFIFWLLLDDIQSSDKIKKVIKTFRNRLDEVEYSELIKNNYFILNKYRDTDIQNDFSKQDINLSGYLPYISEWDTNSNIYQILNNDLYNKKVNSLLNSIGINN